MSNLISFWLEGKWISLAFYAEMMLPEGNSPSVPCACLQSCNWDWAATSPAAFWRGSHRLPLHAELGVCARPFCRCLWPDSNLDSFISFIFFFSVKPFAPDLFSISFPIFGMLSVSPKFLKGGFFCVFPSYAVENTFIYFFGYSCSFYELPILFFYGFILLICKCFLCILYNNAW